MAIKSPTGLSNFDLPSNGLSGVLPGTIFPARVAFTLINDTDNPNLFNLMGGFSNIGCIKFETIRPIDNRQARDLPTAIPLFPNIKHYPLKKELVYIISLPNVDLNSRRGDQSFYYFHPINLWNSNNHNGLKLNKDYLQVRTSTNYEQSERGFERSNSSNPESINLGNTFIEKENLRSVQTYEGDIVYEGRFGQSLRFGSTVYPSNNPWSRDSQNEPEKNGDPITILTTDQTPSDVDPWIPYIENINTDISSIYLTSTQNIPIEVSSKSYKSFIKGLEPKLPEQFAGEQIILNSGRLLLNSKSDNILLSSNDSINLNAQETVNIDAVEGFVVDSPEVLLGSKDATEPIILGDKFLDDIEDLAQVLLSLGNNLELNPMLITPASPNASLVTIGGSLRQKSKRILDNIEKYKSKVSFSK